MSGIIGHNLRMDGGVAPGREGVALMNYTEMTRAEIETIAGAIADILQTHGFEMMAADCRGDRKDASLARYARAALNVTRRYSPAHLPALADKFRRLELI